MVDAQCKEAAQRGTGHKHRRQQSARCAGSQRNHESQRLEDGDQKQQLPGQIVVQDVRYSVVTDAEDSRHEIPNDPKSQRADRRMPKFIDRQTLELILV